MYGYLYPSSFLELRAALYIQEIYLLATARSDYIHATNIGYQLFRQACLEYYQNLHLFKMAYSDYMSTLYNRSWFL